MDTKIAIIKKYFVNIYFVFIFAVVLRLIMFGGFVMGDDPSYADLVHEILQGQYPPLHGPNANLFSFRPLFLLPVAASMKLFGWSEFSFVLPVFLCSVFTVFIIYGICLRLFDKATGLLAAFLYSVFPLNLVHATTMTNDIMIAFLIALSAFFYIEGLQTTGRKATIFFALSGIALGLGTGIKINSQAALGIFVLYIGMRFMRKEPVSRNVLWLFASWALVQSVFCSVYYVQAGNPFAHITSELAFRQEHAEHAPNTWQHIRWLLLIYPRYMLCLAKEGLPGYEYLPYGYFYWVLPLALLYSILRKDKRVIFLLVWLVVLFLFAQFAFVNLWPYRPIVRLPRGLEIITVPTVVLIAYALIGIYKKSSALKYTSICVAVFLIISSLYHAGKKAYAVHDATSDAKKAFTIIQQRPQAPVITDPEMQYKLRFYGKYKNNERIRTFSDQTMQYTKGSIVILGGGRTMMIRLFWKKRFPQEIPSNWKKIVEFEGEKKPWRIKNLTIYEVGDDI